MKEQKGSKSEGKRCAPCEGGLAKFLPQEARSRLKELRGWQLAEDSRSIGIDYRMKDFMAAVDLIRRIAEVAESENHHPDLRLTGYRNLRIELSTHAIGGLSENDFILAEKISALPKALKETA